MNWRNVLGASALVCATAMITTSVVSQDPPADQPWDEEAMAKMMQYMTPGEEHARLQEFVGKWDTEVRSWHSPDAEPETMPMSAEYDIIMDGRFLRGKYSGSWQDMEFKGMDIMGYDKVREEYVSIWLDNMGTSIMVSRGTYDEDKNVIEMSGTHSCPMTGDPNRPMRTVLHLDGEDAGYTMYSRDEQGREFKSMEVRSTRKAE